MKRSLALVLLFPFLSACSDPVDPVGEVSVALAYESVTMAVAQQLIVTVTVRDAAGNALGDRAASWQSSDPSVVTVEAGVLKARAVGGATVTATVDGESATVSVEVMDFASITSAGDATCALTADGDLFCAGGRYPSPLAPIAPSLRWKAVAGSGWQGASGHFCGIGMAGELLCWGRNTSGQLGVGDVTDRNAPTLVGIATPVTHVAVGESHTCAVTEDDSVWCWGQGDAGQLGSDVSESTVPLAVHGVSGASMVAAGAGHSCVLAGGGEVFCWGRNELGQLGRGAWSADGVATPGPVESDLSFTEVRTWWTHTCALTVEGAAYCWGNNRAHAAGGQVSDSCRGDGHECRESPSPVAGDDRFVALAVGGFGGCGLTSSGQVRCWGLNARSSRGAPDSGGCSVPGTRRSCTAQPTSGPTGFQSLSGSGWNYCGMHEDGGAYCWGDNSAGQLGAPGMSESVQPIAVGVDPNFER